MVKQLVYDIKEKIGYTFVFKSHNVDDIKDLIEHYILPKHQHFEYGIDMTEINNNAFTGTFRVFKIENIYVVAHTRYVGKDPGGREGRVNIHTFLFNSDEYLKIKALPILLYKFFSHPTPDSKYRIP